MSYTLGVSSLSVFVCWVLGLIWCRYFHLIFLSYFRSSRVFPQYVRYFLTLSLHKTWSESYVYEVVYGHQLFSVWEYLFISNTTEYVPPIMSAEDENRSGLNFVFLLDYQTLDNVQKPGILVCAVYLGQPFGICVVHYY